MTTATSMIAATALAVVMSTGARAQEVIARPIVGQLAAVLVTPDSGMTAQLHHQGWIEARGQLLEVVSYPELFDRIGRAWTSKRVPDGRFALPDIQDRSEHSLSSDNPFGVLGPGDLITSENRSNERRRRNLISYWIYAGHDVPSTAVTNPRD